MKQITTPLLIILLLIMSCSNDQKEKITTVEKSSYFDYSNSDDQVTGGIKMIPIETPKGTFNV